MKRGKWSKARLLEPLLRSKLDLFSPDKVVNILEKLSLTNDAWPNDAYSVFSADVLYLFHLAFPKRLKKYIMS